MNINFSDDDISLQEEIADIIFEYNNDDLIHMECCTQLAIKIINHMKRKGVLV